MISKVLLYALFLVFIFAGIYSLHYFEIATEEKHPGTTDLSLEMDLHLSNAKLYIKEKSVERSLFHLQKAIHSIELIEEVADSISHAELELAVRNLKQVIRDVEYGKINYNEINHSSIMALNAVATSQLRLSEKYLIHGQKQDAEYALKYASEHLHNALKFASNEEFKGELSAYRHIDSLVHAKLDTTQVPEIENAITEINGIE